MRTAFFALLLANVLFLAWAEWVDVPVPSSDPIAALPRLQIVNASAGAASAGASSLSAALAAPPPAGVAETVQPPAPQCVSIGPFDQHADATQAETLLRAQQLSPQERMTSEQPVRWYWVYLPDLTGNGQVQQVLARLKRNHIDGAEPMPTADGNPAISLGMFHDQQLAERQEQLARDKGYRVALAERLVSQPAYWLDLWITGGPAALPMPALQAKVGAPVGTQSCPSGTAPPAPANATGPVSPGIPAPADRTTAAPSPPASSSAPTTP